MGKSILEIAQLIGGEVDGDDNIEVMGLADIANAKEGMLVFAENDKWLDKAEETSACAIVVSKTVKKRNKTLIRTEIPKLAFGMLMRAYESKPNYEPGVHPSAVIGKNVDIAEGVSIQPYVVIGDNVKIGKNTVVGALSYIGQDSVIGIDTMIYPRVMIYHGTVIGNDVILHSGVVLGSDGFGYEQYEGRRIKIPQIGKVVINDDVEIGANTAIDRATLGETVIGEGTKIDNLVQIAHNDVIGKNSIFCSQAGISGSCVIGDNVIIAGQAGLADHVTVGNNVIIGAQAGIPTNKIIRGDQMVFGAPARPAEKTKKLMAAQARLPLMVEKIKKMEAEIEMLKEAITVSKTPQ